MSEVRSKNGCYNCRKRRRKCSEDRPGCQRCTHTGLVCKYPARDNWINVTVASHHGRATSTSSGQSHATRVKKRKSAKITSLHQAPLSASETPATIPQVAITPNQLAGLPFTLPASLIDSPIHTAAENADEDHWWSSLGFTVNAAGSSQNAHEEMQASKSDHDVHDVQQRIDIGEDEAVLVDNETPRNTDNLSITSTSQEDWDFDRLSLLSHDSLGLWETPGERIAFFTWMNYLAEILPAFSSFDNPFKGLSMVALSSPVLLDTVVSLGTLWMHCHGRVPLYLAAKRYNKALQSLQQALIACTTVAVTPRYIAQQIRGDGGELSCALKRDTLATVLLQITHVVLTGGRGIDMHLSCALHLLDGLGYLEHPVTEDAFARMLIQRFAMVDVTTAIIKYRRPLLARSFWLFSPDEYYDHTTPSFRELTGCPQPILGILSKIAIMAAELREGSVSQFSVLEQAEELEEELRLRRYKAFCQLYCTPRTPSNPDMTFQGEQEMGKENRREAGGDYRHLDTLSQCFYWAAHLLLQRLVYRDPTHSDRVQHMVTKLMVLFQSMPVGCGPDSSLTFPLYVAAREAISKEHRTWIKQRNQELLGVYPDRLRLTLAAILEKIWAAIDDDLVRGKPFGDLDAIISALEKEHDFCLL